MSLIVCEAMGGLQQHSFQCCHMSLSRTAERQSQIESEHRHAVVPQFRGGRASAASHSRGRRWRAIAETATAVLAPPLLPVLLMVLMAVALLVRLLRV